MKNPSPPLQVEQLAIGKVLRYARNTRLHSPEQIAQIVASIRQFGFVNPVLVDANGVLIAGHGRVEAAGILEMSHIPAIRLGHLTETQAKALRISDNAIPLNASWDTELLKLELGELKLAEFDMPTLGFGDLQLVEFMAGTPAPKGDPEALPEPGPAVSRAGDVWICGGHSLTCGDMLTASDGRDADLCFTSMPYGVGLEYGDYQDTFANCCELIRAAAPVIFGRLRKGGFCVLNFGDIIAARDINGSVEPSEYPMALEYWPAFTGAGFVLNSRRIWAKPHAKIAAPWTASSNRAASDWEHIWCFLKPGGKFINERLDVSPLGVWDSSRLEGVEIGKERHPAAFPVGIARLVLEIYSRRGDAVFEPFTGTGTTMIAAELTGRHCHGIEIDPTYVDMAVRRWQEFAKGVAVIEADGRTFDEVAKERLAQK
jgi:DNA modification methylase